MLSEWITVTILVVAIAKFRRYDKNRDKKQHARLVIINYYLIFGDSSSKGVDTAAESVSDKFLL